MKYTQNYRKSKTQIISRYKQYIKFSQTKQAMYPPRYSPSVIKTILSEKKKLFQFNLE